jgi:hypothetical protein
VGARPACRADERGMTRMKSAHGGHKAHGTAGT